MPERPAETGTSPPNPAPAVLRRLAGRRDGPGLARAALQFAGFGLSALAAQQLGERGHPGAVGASALAGLAVLTFFPLLHESGHGTAFVRERWNRLAAWVGALFMLQAPSFFREFHLAHHQWTQDRERDPEIASIPNLLDPWPGSPVHYLAIASGQWLMVGKFGFSLICALLPYSVWKGFFPFVREGKQRRIAWESRLAVVVLVGAAWAGLALVPGFAYVLLAWPIAHLGLGLYLMTEHTGLPNQGSQFDRTRTVRSNPAVRWLMWNMPYHAEHHAFPGIPFHALPALEAEIQLPAPKTATGYLAFHREAIRRSFSFQSPGRTKGKRREGIGLRRR